MMEFESQRIQRLLVRNESEIWILRGFFYKNMRPKEIEAYRQISPFQPRLLDEANIMIPNFEGHISEQELIELKNVYDIHSQDLYKISLLEGIKHKKIDENYGSKVKYSQEDFLFIFKSLAAFRNIVKPNNLTLAEDYENTAIDLLKESKILIDKFTKFDDKTLFRYILDSSKILRGASLVAAHRDLNWSNLGLLVKDKKIMQIVDWESFGMAYEGYDEGRLFTRLCFNTDLQRDYITSINNFINIYKDPETGRKFIVSFWRTAGIRSFREIYLILNGRYDRLIENHFRSARSNNENKKNFKIRFISSLENIINLATENLARVLSG
jgi:thiamine kinase-like enzyme